MLKINKARSSRVGGLLAGLRFQLKPWANFLRWVTKHTFLYISTYSKQCLLYVRETLAQEKTSLSEGGNWAGELA